MVQINSDDKDIKAALTKLAGLVAGEGGVLGDHLTIECSGGNFRITSDLPADSKEDLISIPRSCFLPLTRVEFGLDGDAIRIVSGTKALSAPQREMLALMIDLYNRTGKIAKYKAASPRIVFRNDPDLVAKLVAGRAGTGLARRFYKVMKTETLDDLVVDFFFRTRNFNLDGEKRQIIPFIDFTNHHTMARPFRRERENGKLARLVLENQKPVAGSDECFARYGLWDPYDTYLMFGFATSPGAFVRSIPVEMNLRGLGVLKIRAVVAGPGDGKVLGPTNKDLVRLYPDKVQKTKKGLTVSNLKIPDEKSPRAFRRILGIFVAAMGPGLKPALRDKLVAEVEEKVLGVNQAYFTRLGKYLEQAAPGYPDCPALDEALKMTQIQLQTLARYRAAQAPKR